ncbi:hypothetical protein FL857_10695 [Criibacterium bergeronii]|uniref:Uncharacterized protein n=1 Tax=Criibacterium bergeronii TaxID=1871336 RepID=A0A552UXJ2_9FIRM|nr:hypothetical protein [Criibacterium bergeronii]TRW22929.1 hypothetical protein FL857_10695 [Criibacterium bergeronii]
MLIVKENKEINNNNLYGFILNMRRLLPKDEFKRLKAYIINLSEQYKFVDLKYYGIRQDWKEKL